MLYRDEKYQAAKRLIDSFHTFEAIKILSNAAMTYEESLPLTPEFRTERLATCGFSGALMQLRQQAFQAKGDAFHRFRSLGHYTAGRPDEAWLALAKSVVTRYEKKGRTS